MKLYFHHDVLSKLKNIEWSLKIVLLRWGVDVVVVVVALYIIIEKLINEASRDLS